MQPKRTLIRIGTYISRLAKQDIETAIKFYNEESNIDDKLMLSEDLEYAMEEISNDILQPEKSEINFWKNELFYNELRSFAMGFETVFKFGLPNAEYELIKNHIAENAIY